MVMNDSARTKVTTISKNSGEESHLAETRREGVIQANDNSKCQPQGKWVCGRDQGRIDKDGIARITGETK
jgi:hypothetical protein